MTKYPGYEYAFEIGQHVIIVARPDVDYGAEGIISGFSYYPDNIVYELKIPDGHTGAWFWKEIKFRHRGFTKSDLMDAIDYRQKHVVF